MLKKYLTHGLAYGSIIHGSLVKRLRRRPLTAETRVRFPYGLLKFLPDMVGTFLFYKIKNIKSLKSGEKSDMITKVA